MSDPRPSGFIFSLKWKALLLSSLILLAVTGSFAGLSYYELTKQFGQRREDLQKQYALQVQGLLDQSSDRLQQLAMTVASLNAVKSAFSASPSVGESAALGALWANLELNQGIETIEIIAPDGQRLAATGVGGKCPEASPAVMEVMRQVSRSEIPRNLIECLSTCLHYAAAPVDAGNGRTGTLLLGVSLAELVLELQRVSGTDLALIVEQSTDALPVPSDRWIGPWHAHVVAITNSAVNLPALQALSSAGISLAKLRTSTYTELNGRDLETRVFPLSGFSAKEKAYLAVIADIGGYLTAIRRATRLSLYVGAAGLLVSECFLLLILWLPMSRLKRAAMVLPRLADGAFPEVRAAMSAVRRKRWLRDEVDVLHETAISLSDQLERLNHEVADRSRDLSERMGEIIRERNFVTSLLETAKAIILTQDADNRIVSVNSFAQELTGFGKQELCGRPFVEMVANVPQAGCQQQLRELAAGGRDDFEEERDVVCKSGATVNIAWRHSRLDDSRKGAAAILSIGIDITDRKRAELELAWMADHDPLTGLFNRRRFEHELEQALASAMRYGHSGALLFFDLDQFKYINDTSGHNAGDRLLVGIGESLPRLLRTVDVTGRLGGDEFAVILSRATGDEAVNVAEKILAHVREMEFTVGERVHKVSASLGIALFPEHGSNIQDLLTRADLAMYQVKESGRGGWYLFSDSDQTHRLMQERVMWKQKIEGALKDHGFLLFVQPIVSIQDRSAHHFEVLLRMRGDGGSIVGPVNFIEVAERSGLINAIDRMAMAEAIRFLAQARKQGRILTFTVNLSAHAFHYPELLKHLEHLLDETGLDPQQVVFEMTETAALADLSAARRLMESINAIGCRFALDDFGTGFSTFYYLRQQLPFDFIKIDGSFIRNLADRPDDKILVRHMGDIAREFDRKSIAEHVEDLRTLELLKEFGIDYAQGYFTGRPMPIENLLSQDWQPELRQIVTCL